VAVDDDMRVGRTALSAGEAKSRADAAALEFIALSERSAPLLASSAPQVASRRQALTADDVRMGVMSGIAGYVDAAGFVTLVGLFPAHVTGELVGAAVALSSGQLLHNPSRLAILPIFVLSVVLGALVSRAFRKRGRSPLAALFGLMALTLAFFSASDAVLPLFLRPASGMTTVLREGTAVAAMGFQNVIMRRVLSTSCPTTVMTGNLTQFIIELVELVVGRRQLKRDERSNIHAESDLRLRLVGTALGAFAVSAILGGFLTTTFGTISVALPGMIVAVLAWRELRRPTPATRTGTLF
jgi:uncharacterized membrane protein YoaK (UPF0700 family)